MITVTDYGSWDLLERYRPDWNSLVAQSAANEVFSTFEFLKAWAISNTRNVNPRVVLVHDGSRLVGIAPLMFAERRRCGMSLRSLEFIGTPHSDYSDFIYRDVAILDRMWQHLCTESAKADLFYFPEVKASSPTTAYLKADRSVISRLCTAGLSARLPETGAPIECYLKGHGLRKRTLRRIEKEGAVTLHVCDSPETIQASLPILFAQHVSRWSGTSTPSRFAQDAVKRMYMNWAGSLGPHVTLYVLALNAAPVACLFGFNYSGKFIAYTVTYNVAYKQFHCGLVCILKVMQILRSRGIDVIDFTRGTEGFKSFFADTETLSYEFIRAQSMKAKCFVNVFLTAKDFVITHQWAAPLGFRLGIRADAVRPKIADPAAPESVPDDCKVV